MFAQTIKLFNAMSARENAARETLLFEKSAVPGENVSVRRQMRMALQKSHDQRFSRLQAGGFFRNGKIRREKGKGAIHEHLQLPGQIAEIDGGCDEQNVAHLHSGQNGGECVVQDAALVISFARIAALTASVAQVIKLDGPVLLDLSLRGLEKVFYHSGAIAIVSGASA